METTIMEFQVPKALTVFLKSQNSDSLLRNALLIYPFIFDKTISHGRAAEMLGINKFDLIALYAKIGIPYFNQPISEIEKDIAQLQKIEGTRAWR